MFKKIYYYLPLCIHFSMHSIFILEDLFFLISLLLRRIITSFSSFFSESVTNRSLQIPSATVTLSRNPLVSLKKKKPEDATVDEYGIKKQRKILLFPGALLLSSVTVLHEGRRKPGGNKMSPFDVKTDIILCSLA